MPPKFDGSDPRIYIELGGIHHWEFQYGGRFGQPTAGAPFNRTAESHGLRCMVRAMTSSHHAFTGDIAVLIVALPASGHVV